MAEPTPTAPTLNTGVLILIGVITVLDVVAGMVIPLAAPTQALPILASVFGFSLTIITLLFAVLRINAVGIAVDGKMSELLEMRGEIAALRATAMEKDRRAGEDAGTALATAAATGTHTTTTTTTILDSPATVSVPVAVPPPAAALPLDVAPLAPVPVDHNPPNDGPSPWGPPWSPGTGPATVPDPPPDIPAGDRHETH